MTNTPEAGVPPLADLVRAARLPDPAERKRIRLAAGLSAERMAAALGVTQPTLTRWENDTEGPSLENAVRYRELLDELAAAVA